MEEGGGGDVYVSPRGAGDALRSVTVGPAAGVVVGSLAVLCLVPITSILGQLVTHHLLSARVVGHKLLDETRMITGDPSTDIRSYGFRGQEP